MKTIKKYKSLLFEIDKTYQTKMSTGEKFTIKEIIYQNDKQITAKGIYEFHPNIGICSYPIDRLIPDKIEDGEINVCEHCGEPI